MLSGNMLKVLQILSEGDSTFIGLKKSTRLSEKMLESIINALQEKEYVMVDGDSIKITQHGKEIIKKTQI